MTWKELDAVHDIAALFYAAGHADGYSAARAEVLCLPPRVPKSARRGGFAAAAPDAGEVVRPPAG